MKSVETETLTAELRNIVYQNDNGFLIGSFRVGNNGRQITGKGNILNPQIGFQYKLSGEWIEDRKYGRQFNIKSFQTLEPSDTSAIFKYLVRTTKYVGPKVGQDLVDEFGEDALVILREEPETAANKIKGLSIARAIEIQESLLAGECNEKVMVELWGMLDIPGMRKALPGDLVEKYGSNAAEFVRQNPYLLTDFSGVGFALADRVAINLGYPPDGIERKKAVILHCLNEIGNSAGDIWITRKDLAEKVSEIATNIFNVLDGIGPLIDEEKIEEEAGEYALSFLAENEAYVARKIAEMVKR